MLLAQMCMPEIIYFRQRILPTFRDLLQAAALIRPSDETSVFVKSLHIQRKSLFSFYLHCPPTDGVYNINFLLNG